MKHPVAFPSVNMNSEAKRNKFQAGVCAHALDYYVPEYVPSDTAPLRAFRIEPLQGVDMIEAVVNIMSSIAGNVFGFKAVKLREAMELWGKVKFGVTD
jgi:ribulose 1,5-bisphosphate carboxylase large subunit-like protein